MKSITHTILLAGLTFSLVGCDFFKSITSKNSSWNRGPASVKSKHSQKPVRLLTLKQIGQLHHMRRVQYIQAVHKLYRVAAQFQHRQQFKKNKSKGAQLDFMEWFINQHQAHASNTEDLCLFGYRVIDELGPGQNPCSMTAYLRANPEKRSEIICDVAGAKGYRCGNSLGLHGDYGCIVGAHTNATEFTETCQNVAQVYADGFLEYANPDSEKSKAQILNEVSGKVGVAHIDKLKEQYANDLERFAELKKFLTEDLKQRKNDPKFMKDSINSRIAKLKAMGGIEHYSISPEIMAHILLLVDDYSNYEGDRSELADPQSDFFARLAQEYDSEKSRLESLFQEIVDYCDSPTSRQGRGGHEGANRVRGAQNRNRDVYQIDECLAVDERIANIQDEIDRIEETIDERELSEIIVLTKKRPGGYRLEELPDPPPPPRQNYVGEFACGTSLNTDGVVDRGPFACLACASDYDAWYANNQTGGSGVSKRWMSLLELAARDCMGKQRLSMDEATKFMEVFGRCSTDSSYDWNGSLRDEQKDLVHALHVYGFDSLVRFAAYGIDVPDKKGFLKRVVDRVKNFFSRNKDEQKVKLPRKKRGESDREYQERIARASLENLFHATYGITHDEMSNLFCEGNSRGAILNKEASVRSNFSRKAGKLPQSNRRFSGNLTQDLSRCVSEAIDFAEENYPLNQNCYQSSRRLPADSSVTIDKPYVVYNDLNCAVSTKLDMGNRGRVMILTEPAPSADEDLRNNTGKTSYYRTADGGQAVSAIDYSDGGNFKHHWPWTGVVSNNCYSPEQVKPQPQSEGNSGSGGAVTQ